MNPYGSLANGRYTSADIMNELQKTKSPYQPRSQFSEGGYPSPTSHAYNAYSSYSPPVNALPQQFAQFNPDGFMQRDDGRNHPMQFNPGFGQTSPNPIGASMDQIYEGAIDIQYRQPQTLDERLVEIRNQVVNSVQPTYMYEKTVEVPQVVVKEFERQVRKPEIIERIIEVPKPELVERTFTGPPQVQYQEQIIEVPQVIVEERVIHVPYTEIQERLIEVPKIEFVEKIEYDTYVEYREVPVDKIIEVPQIEYIERQVEQYVPQTFISQYPVDKYTEVPVTQIQEVERIEEVPVMMPRLHYPQAPYMQPHLAPPPMPSKQSYLKPPPNMAMMESSMMKPPPNMGVMDSWMRKPLPSMPMMQSSMINPSASMPMMQSSTMQPPMMPAQGIMQSYASYDPSNIPRTRLDLIS